MMGTICTRCEMGVEDDDTNADGVCGRCRMRDDAAALFVLHDSPVFIGQYTGETWNGWDVPLFTLDETRAILEWIAKFGHVQKLSTREDWVNPLNGNVHYYDATDGEFYKIVPDEDGLYLFDGWCWKIVNVANDAPVDVLHTFEQRFSTVPFTVWHDFNPWRDDVRALLNEHGTISAYPCVARWLGWGSI